MAFLLAGDTLWPVCSLLPADALGRLEVTATGFKRGVKALWHRLRAARGPYLRPSTVQALQRLHQLEASLLFDEFGDGSWEERWCPATTSPERGSTAVWEGGPEAQGLSLRGLGARTHDLGAECRPGAVEVLLHARAAPDEAAAVGYFVLSDSARRPCVWVYIEWQRDVVGAPLISCQVNDAVVRLAEWPWGGAPLAIRFRLNWADRELQNLDVAHDTGGAVEFHNSRCSGVRYIALANLHGEGAEARWLHVQLLPQCGLTPLRLPTSCFGPLGLVL